MYNDTKNTVKDIDNNVIFVNNLVFQRTKYDLLSPKQTFLLLLLIEDLEITAFDEEKFIITSFS